MCKGRLCCAAIKTCGGEGAELPGLSHGPSASDPQHAPAPRGSRLAQACACGLALPPSGGAALALRGDEPARQRCEPSPVRHSRTSPCVGRRHLPAERPQGRQRAAAAGARRARRGGRARGATGPHASQNGRPHSEPSQTCSHTSFSVSLVIFMGEWKHPAGSQAQGNHSRIKTPMTGHHLTVFPDSPTSKRCPGPLGQPSLTYNRSSPTIKRGKQCCFKRTHFRHIRSRSACFTHLDTPCGP